MLRKEEILERTSNGLAVFKHYLPGNWRIGRNFLNPLYEDSKASCNIYFDRRGGIYKMKDFGNDSYSGAFKISVFLSSGRKLISSSSFLRFILSSSEDAFALLS